MRDSAAVSADGVHVVTASYDETARVAACGRRAGARAQGAHGLGVFGTVSADGVHVVTASTDTDGACGGWRTASWCTSSRGTRVT